MNKQQVIIEKIGKIENARKKFAPNCSLNKNTDEGRAIVTNQNCTELEFNVNEDGVFLSSASIGGDNYGDLFASIEVIWKDKPLTVRHIRELLTALENDRKEFLYSYIKTDGGSSITDDVFENDAPFQPKYQEERGSYCWEGVAGGARLSEDDENIIILEDGDRIRINRQGRYSYEEILELSKKYDIFALASFGVDATLIPKL